jgi:nitrogen fixation NifU-like protein
MESPDSVAEGVNELCGDRIRFQLKIGDGAIESAMFLGDGCAISIASASILTEQIRGLRISDIRELSFDRLVGDLEADVKPGRLQCVSLPLTVLKDAAAQVGAGGTGK